MQSKRKIQNISNNDDKSQINNKDNTDIDQMDSKIEHAPVANDDAKDNINKHTSIFSTRFILGVDPGLARTGLGLIKEETTSNGVEFFYVNHTLLTTKPKDPTHIRLHSLFEQAQKWLKPYKIDIVIIEELFVGVNRNTIMKLSFAKSMLMLVGALKQAQVFSLPTKIIKQCVGGKGDVDKVHINECVCAKLGIDLKQHDCTDALACALSVILL